MSFDPTGHDWFHVDRVRRLALKIHEKEQIGDRLMIELAALLHDIPDEKLNPTKQAGEEKLDRFLQSVFLEESRRNQLKEIIDSISYKGGNNSAVTSVEAAIVQDADRLDALGAIGIARTFAYGGKKGQPIYDPFVSVREEMTYNEYRMGKTSSINHFYEKLLKLKEIMNTNTGKEMALRRHEYMADFLEEFFEEWNG